MPASPVTDVSSLHVTCPEHAPATPLPMGS